MPTEGSTPTSAIATYVKSLTQDRFGRVAVRSRCTRSTLAWQVANEPVNMAGIIRICTVANLARCSKRSTKYSGCGTTLPRGPGAPKLLSS